MSAININKADVAFIKNPESCEIELDLEISLKIVEYSKEFLGCAIGTFAIQNKEIGMALSEELQKLCIEHINQTLPNLVDNAKLAIMKECNEIMGEVTDVK